MSYPASKLHPLGDHAAWGGSGAHSVLHDLEGIFATEAEEIVSARDVGHELQERMVPVLRRHYELFIPDIPGESLDGTPSAYVLAAGYSQGKAFIAKVDPSGIVGHYEDVGFHAIGSGAPMAQQASALLGHFRMADRPVTNGVVATARVLGALRVSQPTVGGPLNLVRITPDGAHHVDEDEVTEALDDVRRWEDADRRALDSVFDGSSDS